MCPVQSVERGAARGREIVVCGGEEKNAGKRRFCVCVRVCV